MHIARAIAGAALLVAAGPVFSTPPPQAELPPRYRIILDRRPFHEAPPMPEHAHAIPLGQSFAARLRLCGLADWGQGMRVCLSDDKAKRSYYLQLGATDPDSGITAIRSSYEQGKVLLAKNGDEQWLYLQDASIVDAERVVSAAGRPNHYAGPRRQRLRNQRILTRRARVAPGLSGQKA